MGCKEQEKTRAGLILDNVVMENWEAAAITVVLSNSLLLVFFLLVITLGLNVWGKNLDSDNPQNQQICV